MLRRRRRRRGRCDKTDADAAQGARPCQRSLCYWLVGLACVVAMLLTLSILATILLLQRSDANARLRNAEQSNALASQWASRARMLFDSSYYIAQGMRGYIRACFVTLPNVNGTVDERTRGQHFADFERVARMYDSMSPTLAAILLAPGGAVSQMWPTSLPLHNYDLFDNRSSAHGIEPPYATMLEGNIYIEGPLYKSYDDHITPRWLVNIRVPVYNITTPEQHRVDNFWGLVYVVVDVKRLIDDDAFVADAATSYLWYSRDPDGTINAIASTLSPNATQDELRTFIARSAVRLLVDAVPAWYVAVQRHAQRSLLTRTNVMVTAIVVCGGLLLLFVVAALVIERCTRTYDGRLYAPKLTPFALLTVGPCYGEELWNLVPVQMAEVMDRLNRVLNRQMAAHRAYKVAQMQPYTTVFVLRTVEAAVHMSFDVITELQRHPIDADLATLLDEDGQLLMAYAVHLCTDVAIVPSVIGDRGYRYEGADMVYGARMWAFAAPNTVTLSAAAQPHACAMRRQRRGRRRGSSGRKAGGHNSSSGNNNDKTSHNSTSACSNASSALHNSSSSGNSSSSSGNHHSDIVVSAYNTIFLRGVQGKQELYTVTDTTNKWLAQASAIAHARVQRELGAQEQLAQQQHRVRARVRAQGSDGSYNSAVTSSMYYVSSSTTTPCSSSLPAHHLLRSSSSSASSRHDLDASANDRESMATSQSDGTRESQQQQQQQQQHAGVVLPARRAASVTVPPSGLLLAPASYLHDHVSSSSGSNSSGETNHSGGNSRAAATTTTTAATTTMATIVAVSPARALLPHLLTHADGGGASATRAHGDNPLATDTTNDAHTPSAPVTTRDGNRGGSGNLVGDVVAAAVRTTSVAAVVSSSSSSNAKRNSGGGAGATGGPLRVDVPVNPLVVTAAAPLLSTTPTRALTSNAALVQQQQQQQLANTTWKSPSHGSVAAAAAGIDVARSDGATTTTAMHAATSAAVVASATAASMVVNNSVHSAVGNNCSAGGGGGGGVMHAVHHSLAGGRTSASLDATDNPLELGHALHQPTLSSLSGVVVLSEHSDEQRAHEHAGHVQQQQQQQQLHLLQQEQPVSLTTVSSNTLLSGFGPLQCTAPVATATMTTAVAVATTAAANNATATTTTTTTTAAVTPEYGLQEANTCAWLHRAIPLWLDKALRRAFDHQSIALAISYESVRVMVYYFYASYKLLFRPLAVPERDNIYRRLITAFGIPRKDILEHLAARCTIHYMQQHEHTKSLAWKTYARAEA